MAQGETYDVKITSSAETNALLNYQRELTATMTAAKAAGLSTSSLEGEIRKINAQLGASRVRDHAAALTEAITATRAAGRETSELERRLKQLDSLQPADAVAKAAAASQAKVEAAVAAATRASSADLEASIRRAPGVAKPSAPAKIAGSFASAETASLEEYKNALTGLIASARDAGLSTKKLEHDLAGVDRQLGQSRVRDHATALREMITAARAAGQSTAGLEARLKAVEGVRTLGWFGRFGQALRDVAREIPGVGGFVRVFNGASVAVGVVAGALVGLAAKGAQAFSRLARAGMEFNSTLETAEIGLAAVFKQFDQTGRFATFDEARKSASQAIEMLKAAAVSSPASFEALLKGYQSTVGAMSAAGMSMQQQIDTVVLMSQTIAGLGMPDSQLTQEMRAIMTGNIGPDAMVAKTLGITAADIRTAKEAGRLLEFLQEKMAGFGDAGEAAADTFSGRMAGIGDRLQNLAAHFTKPAFEFSKEMAGMFESALAGVEGFLGTDSVDDLDEIGDAAAQAAQSLRDLNQARLDRMTQSAEDAEDAFEALAKSIASVYEMMTKLDGAKVGVETSRLDAAEAAELAGAAGNPRKQEEIKRRYTAEREQAQADLAVRAAERKVRAERDTIAALSGRVSTEAKAQGNLDLAEHRAKKELEAARKEASAALPWLDTDEAHLAKTREAKAAERDQILNLPMQSVRAIGGGAPSSLAAMPRDPKFFSPEERARMDGLTRQIDAIDRLMTAVSADADASKRAESGRGALKETRDAANAEITLAKERLEIEKQNLAAARNQPIAAEAAALAAAADAEVAGKREGRDREIEVSKLEAEARGDKSEARRLSWMADYHAEIDKGAEEWEARRMANARTGAGGKDFEGQFSSQATAGNAVGESLAIARAAIEAGAGGRAKQMSPIDRLADRLNGLITRNAVPVTSIDRPQPQPAIIDR